MLSAPPPLVGFNNNVRYRGMRFHIQTEDSGVTRPHILTHLFADGGRVIKSLRTDYSEYVDHPDRPAMIQRMMRDQHRSMAIDLRDGKLDATIDTLRSQAPEPAEELAEPPRAAAAYRSKEPSSAPPTVVSAQRAAVSAQRAAEPPPDSESVRATTVAEATRETRRSRPPPGRNRRPSRAPEAAKKRRSVAPKARRSLGRPSAVLEAKPSAESIFGAAPQESLDDVILSYVSLNKNTPDSRGRK